MIKRHLKRFLEFSPADRLTLIFHMMRVPFYQLSLKVFGFQRVSKLSPPAPNPDAAPLKIDAAKRQGQLINLAVQAVAGPDNCLLRSVMLVRSLARTGLHPEIKFGIGRKPEDFLAHCWVELDGIPINDAECVQEDHYVFRSNDS